MANLSDLKKGSVIQRDGNLYVITELQFVNPGKGSAFYKTKLKEINTGKTIDNTYKSSESVDIVEVHRQTMQYLYKEGERFAFMDKETYETKEVDADIVSTDEKYLREGLDVIAAMHEGQIVSIELPKKIQYTVTQAPPAVKGDTASGNVTKEIVLDNDLHIQAPIFIKDGEIIEVNTDTGDYAGRVNE